MDNPLGHVVATGNLFLGHVKDNEPIYDTRVRIFASQLGPPLSRCNHTFISCPTTGKGIYNHVGIWYGFKICGQEGNQIYGLFLAGKSSEVYFQG